MVHPQPGERFTAYFGGRLTTSTLVEWVGRKAFFANGWYLVWGGGVI